jgi:tryptophan-rich sensory protein
MEVQAALPPLSAARAPQLREKVLMERKRYLVGLIAWVILCYGAMWVGSHQPPGEWYARLIKPTFTPAGWIIGLVWFVLYTFMGIAAWRVWRKGGFSGARLALALFLVQLALNAAWTYIFFGLQSPGLAFAEIMLLWGAILLTLIAFWKEDRVAGGLMLLYLLWVSFAAFLNFSIWRLNA